MHLMEYMNMLWIVGIIEYAETDNMEKLSLFVIGLECF